ncbi:MAG: DNA alkylation repair protein [Bdellovibrionales bacterium]|nr:DNA alkylation repair protein [Bdellovibrionales bacterium]
MSLQKTLKSMADKEIAKHSQRFFKTGKGEYGEGDIFLGIRVPDLRKLAKEYQSLPLAEVERVVASKYHEQRLVGLLILVYQFEKSKTEKERKKIYTTYLKLFPYINNWDLVDTSCHKIIGLFLQDQDRRPLYLWAQSKNLWVRRISIISTMWFIRHGDLEDSFKIAEILLGDPEDLIHKAVGWVLRECGKKDQKRLKQFLNQHSVYMPRVMLRYSIERLPETLRKQYLKRGR